MLRMSSVSMFTEPGSKVRQVCGPVPEDQQILTVCWPTKRPRTTPAPCRRAQLADAGRH